jgi:hypothetical protein
MMEMSLRSDSEDHSVIRHYLGMTMNQMRHLQVSRVIEANSVLSVLDLGCSEGLLLQKLSRSETIQLLVGVDKDETAVSSAVLVADALFRIPFPRTSNSRYSFNAKWTNTYISTLPTPPNATQFSGKKRSNW